MFSFVGGYGSLNPSEIETDCEVFVKVCSENCRRDLE